MNLQQLRYAVEIEKTSSITAAARNLYMGQPNLSKSIKELENELGTTLFRRTAKGMEPTASGMQFLRYAKGILRQVDELKALYQPTENCVKFSVAVPRATYISLAFSQFLAGYQGSRALDVQYRETNSSDALVEVSVGETELGILRYQTIYENHFSGLIAQNRLVSQVIAEYPMVLLMSERHPLAALPDIPYHLLEQYTQIVHGDIQLPSLPEAAHRLGVGPAVGMRHIYVYDRGSQFDLLRTVPGSYLWVSPLPYQELARHELVQKPCREAGINRDVAVWRAADGLSVSAGQFLEHLRRAAPQGDYA